MSSVDNRVVNMEFNNKDFATKIADTMASLDNLEKALQFKDGKNGIADLGTAVNDVDFSGMASGIESLRNRFSTLGIIGMTVVQNLTNSVMGFVKMLGSKVISGGITRAMNIEQAKFMIEGLDKSWEKLHEDMEYAVADTAFGLDSAAKAAAQLSASQIQAGDDMKQALRGISGVAAMTGSSYDDIANIFTKVAGQGRLMGDDLLSMSSRGMNAAADLAEAMGKTEEEIRDMVSKSQISFEEFAEVMDKKYGEHAKEANRTFTGSLSNVNAALSKLGEGFVEPLIRNKELNDSTYNLINVLNEFKSAIYKVKSIIENLGVYEKWTSAVQKASEVVTKFLDILGGAEYDKDGKLISSMTMKIEAFRKAIGMSVPDFKNLQDAVNGIFSVFRILGHLFTTLITSIFPSLKGGLSDTGSGFLAVVGAIGRWLTGLEKAINESEVFEKVISSIGDVLNFVGNIVTAFTGKISGLFSNGVNGGTNFLTGLINTLESAGNKLKPLKSIFSDVFNSIKDTISNAFSAIGKVFSGENYSKLLNLLSLGLTGGIGFELVGFLKTLTNSVKSVTDSFMHVNVTIKPLEKLFSTLNLNLSELQKNIKADTIMRIAKAIGILAASVFLLSTIKPTRLYTALGAIQVLLLDIQEIANKLMAFAELSGFKTAAKMQVISGSLMALAESLVIMSIAVKILSSMSLADLAKGLGGVAVMLYSLSIFVEKTGSLEARSLRKTTKSIFTLSTALLVLSFAVKQLGSLDLKSLGKGLIGIGVLLTELAIFLRLTSGIKVGLGKGVGLIAISAALLIIAQVVKTIGKLNPEQLAKGLVGLGFVLLELAAFVKLVSGAKGVLSVAVAMLILSQALQSLTTVLATLGAFNEEQLAKGLLGLGGALLIIAGAMHTMPKNMLTASAGLFIAAEAINTIASAMSSIGGMSAEAMAKSLIAMAGALTILAVAMNVMNSSVAGAAAMLIVAGALAVLVPQLLALGNMPLAAIGTALLGLAGAFIVIGAAGAVLGPMAPTLLLFAAAIALVGTGMLAFGIGASAFVSALILCAANIQILADSIPILISTIVKCAAQIGIAGAKIAVSFVKGIANCIGQIVPVAVDFIVGFINGVADKLPDIINAGLNLAVSFINGVADGIDEHGADIIAAVSHLMGSIINFCIEAIKQLVDGLGPLGKGVADELEGVQKEVTKFFGDGKVEKEAEKGAKNTTKAVQKEYKNTAKTSKKELDAIPKSVKSAVKSTSKEFNVLPKDSKKAFQNITKDNTLEKDMPKKGKKAIDSFSNEFIKNAKASDGEKAGKKVADGTENVSMSSSANSMYAGFAANFIGKDWYGKGAEAARKVNKGFKDTEDIHSPSKVFGKFATQDFLGFANRMKKFDADFYKVGSVAAKTVNTGFQSSIKMLSSINLSEIANPVIRPVMDLSNVKMGVKSINSMFGRNQYALGIAGSLPTKGLLSSKNITFNNNITVDGAEDPSKFADEFIQELMIQARTV